MCGENEPLTLKIGDWEGSSPRVRGKRGDLFNIRIELGLIPACAGKTVFVIEMIMAGGAHPRVCGENSRERDSVFVAEGSSPRVRGKRPRVILDRLNLGLIPACAGKTIPFFARS